MIPSGNQIRPSLSFLNRSQIEQIHNASVSLLQSVGNAVYHPQALDLCQAAGCSIKNNLVRVPEEIVEKALESVPKEFTLYSREGKPALQVRQGNVYYGTGPTNPFTLDLETGIRRKTLVEDVEKGVRLADALSNIDFIMPPGSVSDVPSHLSDVHEFLATVTNSTKPIVFLTWSKRNLKAILEIAALYRDSRDDLIRKPFIVHFTDPISPLKHEEAAVENLLYCAELGIPSVYYACSGMGGTSPMDISGSIIQINAEVLFGLVLSQLKNEGTPFIMGATAFPMHMGNLNFITGAPEGLLSCLVHAELSKYYNLPCFGIGGLSDAKVADSQAAVEGSMSTLLSSLAGSTLISDSGQLESGLSASAELILLQNDVIGYSKTICRGIEQLNTENMVDLIRETSSMGTYLATEHTVEHFRKLWEPEIFDRNNCQEWEKNGSEDISKKSRRKIGLILDETVNLDNSRRIQKGIGRIMAGLYEKNAPGTK